MVSWQLNINEGDEYLQPADGLFDVQVTDTFNPFANFGIAKIDDFDGTKFDKFERGTRVDIEYTTGINSQDPTTYTTRLQGFVVERREIENNGSDQLEIEVYSLDQLLRGGKVSQSTKGKTIFEALENIIINDTSALWDPSLVSVEDNFTLRREFKGDKVDTTILTLSFYSENERIRVNGNKTFEFFRQEPTQSPRDIGKTEWFYADIPEDGKEVVNECRVFFDGGDELAVVETSADKLALQDSLGLNDPYSTVKQINRPEITAVDDAKREGEQVLADLAKTTPITVTTFGLEDARPGDVINVTIPEKGVNGDFEIASISYNWSNDETDLILIENTGYQDDLLTRVNDRLDRVELEGVNQNASQNKITDTRLGMLIDVSVTVDGVTFDDTRFTNQGREKLRNGYGKANPLNITDIAIGNDPTGLNRSNTTLGAETVRNTPTESLVGTNGVEYTAGFGIDSADEVGLFDASGDLIARAVNDSTVSSSTLNVSVTLTVTNNANISNGVVTDLGQEVARDVLAANNPLGATHYGYGTSDTAPSETDTTLLAESIKVSLDNVLVANAETTENWNDIV